MGFMDAFKEEDRVNIKVSQLIDILRTDALNYTANMVLINGLKAGLKHEDILTMIGEHDTAEVQE